MFSNYALRHIQNNVYAAVIVEIATSVRNVLVSLYVVFLLTNISDTIKKMVKITESIPRIHNRHQSVRVYSKSEINVQLKGTNIIKMEFRIVISSFNK